MKNKLKYLIFFIYIFNINSLFFKNYKIDKLRHNNIPIKYYSNKYTKNMLYKKMINYDLYSGVNLNHNFYNISLEHVYPKSMLDYNIYPCQDMHNLYLTHKHFNNHRSNYKYIGEDSYLNIKDILKCFDYECKNLKSNSFNLYMPYLYSRGKISRSIAYMNIMYPTICDIKKINDCVIDIELLKLWNMQYPPDKREIQRNDLIKLNQGNHNPFIINYKLINKLL